MVSRRGFGKCVDTGLYALVKLSLEEMYLRFQGVAESLVRTEGVEGHMWQVGNGFLDILLDEIVGISYALLYAWLLDALKHSLADYDAMVCIGGRRIIGFGISVEQEEIVIGSHDFGLGHGEVAFFLRALGFVDVADDNVVVGYTAITVVI